MVDHLFYFEIEQKTTFFPIENDGTLMDLKNNIELYVNVPAERQVLKTLNETMNGRDSTKIRDICDVEGSPILLLYSCDSFYQEELQFVCFLQIYNDKEALKQQEMEERAVKAEKNVVKSSTSKTSSGETLVVGSDSELETDSSNDCFESQSDSDTESDGTDISESSGGSCKKRQKNFKDNNNHIIKK